MKFKRVSCQESTLLFHSLNHMQIKSSQDQPRLSQQWMYPWYGGSILTSGPSLHISSSGSKTHHQERVSPRNYSVKKKSPSTVMVSVFSKSKLFWSGNVNYFYSFTSVKMYKHTRRWGKNNKCISLCTWGCFSYYCNQFWPHGSLCYQAQEEL